MHDHACICVYAYHIKAEDFYKIVSRRVRMEDTLGASVRAFTGRVKWVGKTHPKCGQDHSKGWDLHLNRKEMEPTTSIHLTLSSSCSQTIHPDLALVLNNVSVASCLMFLPPHDFPAMDCTLKLYPKQANPPSLCCWMIRNWKRDVSGIYGKNNYNYSKIKSQWNYFKPYSAMFIGWCLAQLN